MHKDFDENLLRQLQHWRATLRCELVIGGDWNHELTAEGAEARVQWKAGGDWLQRAGLTDLRVNSSRRRVTYVGARARGAVGAGPPASHAPVRRGMEHSIDVGDAIMAGHEVGHAGLAACI